MEIIERLEKACASNGVTLKRNGPGHYKLNYEDRVLNYWPESKNLSAHMAGEQKGVRGVTIQMAIEYVRTGVLPGSADTVPVEHVYNTVIDIVLELGCSDGGMELLRLWNEGDWPAIARQWPDRIVQRFNDVQWDGTVTGRFTGTGEE